MLRGFALLGIFVAHVPGFSGWDSLSASERTALDPGWDVPLQFLRDLFVRGKFYSLFSLLFGIGFAIQQASAGRRGSAFAPQFRRRQLGMLLIGALHSAVWHGDILLTYAALGLLLLPFAHWEPRRILKWALAALALRGLWGALMLGVADALSGIADANVGDGAGGIDVAASVSAIQAGYFSPDWGEMFAANAHFVRVKWLLTLFDGRLFSIGGFFLLGVALGKLRIHERLESRSADLLGASIALGALGLVGNLGLALLWDSVPVYPPTRIGVATNFLYAVAVPSLALAMAATIALGWLDARARRWLSIFAWPGRMALSTYLCQTLVGIGLFYGVGFGLRGSFSLTQGLILALLVFAVQAGLARLWLTRFSYGPVEWLWRCATYRRMLSLRRPARIEAAYTRR